MKKAIKLDTQNGYILWQLTIDNEICYNISLINEPIPDYGYYDPKQIERVSPVSFKHLI